MNPSSAIPRRILWLIGSFAVLGSAFGIWLGGTSTGHPDPRASYNACFVIFARDEGLWLALVAAFSLVAALYFFRHAGRKRVPLPQPAGPSALLPVRGVRPALCSRLGNDAFGPDPLESARCLIRRRGK